MELARLTAAGLLVALAAGCAGGGAPGIVSQAAIGENACGPAAVLNALLWGRPELRAVAARLPGETAEQKVLALIERYGRRPSEAYGPPRTRYADASGVTWVDLTALVNDLLAEHGIAPLRGRYLDRSAGEALEDHVRRVHRALQGSLRRGVPALLSLRSFAPTRRSGGEGYEWSGLMGHWVTVVSVQEEVAENEKGFRFTYLDPATGKAEHGYVFCDEARNFTAAKGDAERWEWKGDRPFLLVTAPSLRLLTQSQSWHVRTIVTVNYAVYAD
jgi:hypothetical protein